MEVKKLDPNGLYGYPITDLGTATAEEVQGGITLPVIVSSGGVLTYKVVATKTWSDYVATVTTSAIAGYNQQVSAAVTAANTARDNAQKAADAANTARDNAQKAADAANGKIASLDAAVTKANELNDNVTSMEARVSNVGTVIDNANKATSAANTAAQSVNDAKAQATAAAKSANDAAKTATDAAKTATDAAGKADQATASLQATKENAEKATTAANLAAKNANDAAENANSATTSANNAIQSAIETATDQATRNVKEAVSDVIEQAKAATTSAKEVVDAANDGGLVKPTEMTLTYPSRITVTNKEPAKITALMKPSTAMTNLLFLGDNNAVTVMPDGTLYPQHAGKSLIHVIPTQNTQLFQSIIIEVIPQVVLLENKGIRLTSNGNMLLS